MSSVYRSQNNTDVCAKYVHIQPKEKYQTPGWGRQCRPQPQPQPHSSIFNGVRVSNPNHNPNPNLNPNPIQGFLNGVRSPDLNPNLNPNPNFNLNLISGFMNGVRSSDPNLNPIRVRIGFSRPTSTLTTNPDYFVMAAPHSAYVYPWDRGCSQFFLLLY